MKKGFTLLELLVVVLIAGILAAIALPQYQKAVLKSRFVQAKVTARRLADAQEAYYLVNSKYTAQFAPLGVDMHTLAIDGSCKTGVGDCVLTTSWGSCGMQGRGQVFCDISYQDETLRYAIFTKYSNTSWKGETYCFAIKRNLTASDMSYKFCQQETNRQQPSSSWSGGQVGFLY